MLRVNPTAVQLSGTANRVECLGVGLTDTVCIRGQITCQVIGIVHWPVAHGCSVLLVDDDLAHGIIAEISAPPVAQQEVPVHSSVSLPTVFVSVVPQALVCS